MEPSVLGTAFMEGGPDRKIKLDRSPGVDEVSQELSVSFCTLLSIFIKLLDNTTLN